MRIRVAVPALFSLVCSLLLVLPTPAAAQDNADLLATLSQIEQSLWQGWKDHDLAPFRTHMADEALNIGSGGISAGKQETLDFMEHNPCDVSGFTFSDWAVHPLTDDVAILTYHATQDAVCDGETLPSPVNVSSVYVRREGQWMAASYQETPATEPGM